MDGQPNREIEFEHYEGPDAPPVDRRRTQFHVPTNITPRSYKCQECPHSFDRPSSLAQHMLSHTGERPHLCTFCNVKRFATTSNLYRHMRGCPQNPNSPKGRAPTSRSDAPPPLSTKAAESSNTYHTQSPDMAVDAPHFGDPGSYIDDEGASTSIQSPPALLRPGPQDLHILPVLSTTTSGSDDREIRGTNLQSSAATWGDVSSSPSQGHVDGSAVSFPYVDANLSHWYHSPVHPSIPLERNQGTPVVQNPEESRFYREPGAPTSQEPTTSLVQSSTAELTASGLAQQPSRFVYPSTRDVAHDALRSDVLPANVVLAASVRQPPQLSRPSPGTRSREAGSSSAGFEHPMAAAELPFPINPIAPTASFPEELRSPDRDTEAGVPSSPPT